MVFVGRERELARLAGALQRAVAGRPSRVVVTGPAGAGVTRLLDELATRVESLPEVVIVRGAALEPAAGEPYRPLLAGLEATLAGLSDARLRSVVGRAAHDLGALMPVIGDRMDALGIDRSPPRLVAPDQLGSRVLEALLGLIERLAATGVVLLILEDLHWADPATRAFVGAMLRVRRHLPLCLVLTYRPDDLWRRHPWRPIAASLAADVSTERIDLAPLDTETLERLVTGLQGSRPAGDLMAAIQVGSAGSPLMVRHLLLASRSVAGVRLSDSFEDGLGAMLDGLPPGARAVVRLLAAARQPLPRSMVARARPDGLRITAAAITAAVESELVTTVGDRLVIIHELHAEAIESLELPSARVQLHGSLADMLEAFPSRAAWHLELAGRTPDALAAHRRAAEVASRTDPGETTLAHRVRVMELSAAVTAVSGRSAGSGRGRLGRGPGRASRGGIGRIPTGRRIPATGRHGHGPGTSG